MLSGLGVYILCAISQTEALGSLRLRDLQGPVTRVKKKKKKKLGRWGHA